MAKKLKLKAIINNEEIELKDGSVSIGTGSVDTVDNVASDSNNNVPLTHIVEDYSAFDPLQHKGQYCIVKNTNDSLLNVMGTPNRSVEPTYILPKNSTSIPPGGINYTAPCDGYISFMLYQTPAWTNDIFLVINDKSVYTEFFPQGGKDSISDLPIRKGEIARLFTGGNTGLSGAIDIAFTFVPALVPSFGDPSIGSLDVMGQPDINSREVITTIPWTADEDCWAQGRIDITNNAVAGWIGVVVNGIGMGETAFPANTAGSFISSLAPVFKGQVVTLSNVGNGTLSIIKFKPKSITAAVPKVNSLLTMAPPDNNQKTTVSTDLNGSWTADEDCWVKCTAFFTGVTNYVQLNVTLGGLPIVSKTEYLTTTGQFNLDHVPFQVAKGQTVTWITDSINGTATLACYKILPLLRTPLLLEAAPVLDYSMIEQETGRRWIDGRMVYEKTIRWTATAVSAGSLVSLGSFADLGLPSTIKQIGNVNVTLLDDTYHGEPAYIGESHVWIRNNSDYPFTAGKSWYLTLRYVK